jgi:DNA-binding NarL/FixJ family response regulator
VHREHARAYGATVADEPSPPRRLVVVEDDVLVRAGIEALFATVESLDVVATCGSFVEALDVVATAEPDVVLTDIRMPPTHTDEGIRLARHLRDTRPDVGVVVLSQYVEPAYALALVADGSSRRAYLLKEHIAHVEQVAAAVEAVATGGSSIDPAVVDALLDRRSASSDDALDRLTPRELEVLSAVARGSSNAAIAEQLFIGDRAVEKHINSIFSKLGFGEAERTHRRVAAVLLFLQSGRAREA